MRNPSVPRIRTVGQAGQNGLATSPAPPEELLAGRARHGRTPRPAQPYEFSFTDALTVGNTFATAAGALASGRYRR
jgi:hypothetical protein